MAKAEATVEELVGMIERGDLRTRPPGEADESGPVDYPKALRDTEEAEA